MSPEQVKLIKSSFASVLPITEETCKLFYERLFALDPALRPWFKGDIAEQSRCLMRMIAVAVSSLDRLESIVPTLKALGVWHCGFGVMEAHCETVGQALLWALEQRLGGSFTPDIAEAWSAALQSISTLIGVLKACQRDRPQPKLCMTWLLIRRPAS